MMATTHRLGGLAAGTALAALLQADLEASGILLAGALLGSLIPDIDNKQSSISRKWPLAGWAVSAGQTIIRGISWLLPRKPRNYIRSLIGHRGLTHSLMPVIVLPLLVMLAGKGIGYVGMGKYAAAGLAGGILSHLILDMLAGGVPLFIPFSTKRFCLAKIKTGGAAEWLFRAAILVIFLFCGLEVIPWQELLQV